MTKCFCYGCGIEKDQSVLELYTGKTSTPVQELWPPLCVLDCVATWRNFEEWKTVVVCFSCLDRLHPDMWISIDCWERLEPFIPFDKLPDLIAFELDWDVVRIEEARQEQLKKKAEKDNV